VVPDWSKVLDVPPFLRSASYGTTSEQLRAYSPVPVVLTHIELGREFFQRLNSFSDDLSKATKDTIEERSLWVKLMEYTGLGMSGILLAWLVRSGTLLASVLAALPAWRNFDPIAILDMGKKDRKRWTKEMKKAAEKELQQHQGLDQILEPKAVNPSPPSSMTPPRSS
jgi:hypothetical protein